MQTTRHRTAVSRSGGTRAGSNRSQRTRHTDKRFRPFALRALMTFWPLRVDIRARKPCVRLRFSTLGWNVRFMMIRPREPKGSGILRSTIQSVNLVRKCSWSWERKDCCCLLERGRTVYKCHFRRERAARWQDSSCGYARWKQHRTNRFSFGLVAGKVIHKLCNESCTSFAQRVSSKRHCVEDCCRP